jgi:hypothetical protein
LCIYTTISFQGSFWKKTFLLVSLWHFHVYMCYNPIWFTSFVFFLSTLVFLLSPGDFNRYKSFIFILV